MKFDKTIIANQNDMEPERVRHGDFAYDKRVVIPKTDNQCNIVFMEIPPGKSPYPNHHHLDVTEAFYIISGEGKIKTPEGERRVTAGDLIAFPPGEAGAHRIWNASETEPLRYVDFDTAPVNDVIRYPDSGKIGFDYNGKTGAFFLENDSVGYYEGE